MSKQLDFNNKTSRPSTCHLIILKSVPRIDKLDNLRGLWDTNLEQTSAEVYSAFGNYYAKDPRLP